MWSEITGSGIVLLVEDEGLLRAVVADTLEEIGFHVIQARDAEEALIIMRDQTDIQVLFTNRTMPGALNGLAFAHIMRQQKPHLAIIVTSGEICPTVTDLPVRARFLQKPYRLSTLIEVIRDLIGTAATSDQRTTLIPASITGKPILAEGTDIAAAPLSEPDKT